MGNGGGGGREDGRRAVAAQPLHRLVELGPGGAAARVLDPRDRRRLALVAQQHVHQRQQLDEAGLPGRVEEEKAAEAVAQEEERGLLAPCWRCCGEARGRRWSRRGAPAISSGVGGGGDGGGEGACRGGGQAGCSSAGRGDGGLGAVGRRACHSPAGSACGTMLTVAPRSARARSTRRGTAGCSPAQS